MDGMLALCHIPDTICMAAMLICVCLLQQGVLSMMHTHRCIYMPIGDACMIASVQTGQ